MYGKVFSSLWHGSLLGQGDTQLVFCLLIAHSDAAGNVEAHPVEIAAWTGKPLEIVSSALEVLMAPDSDSRTPEQEGRRIIRNGLNEWHIVNYKLYRGMRDEGERREQNKQAQGRRRDKNKSAERQPLSAERQPLSAHGEGEGEVEGEGEGLEKGLPPSLKLSPAPSGADSLPSASREAIAGIITSLAKSKRMPRKTEDWRVGAWEDAKAIATSPAQADSMMELAGWLRKNGQTQDRIAISRMFRLIVQHGVKNPMAYFSHNGEALNAILGTRAVEHAEAEQREFQKADAALGLSRRG